MDGQLSLDDLGTPLREVTFVVVDLETTGGSPADAGITEIGAVKVRAGEVIGEFGTLVDPGMPIPPFVVALTGITEAMLIDAPSVPEAVMSFWEFARGAVIVAHNAPYDVGFLRGASDKHGMDWPAPRVADTARIARRALHRDEVRNCKLSTLATFFRSPSPPTHRALDDARATVAVLHGLFDRIGSLGVETLEDLLSFGGRTTTQQRTKRHLAADLPEAPGVYVFEDRQGKPLYVGTSRNLRRRVRTYFTASETRPRMSEMVGLADHVRPIVCATELEARVRELRLIADYRPAYNRRSRHPERLVWLVLNDEAYPRAVTVPRARMDQPHLGPFPGRRAAASAAEALHAVLPLRTCTDRLPKTPRRDAGCVRAQLAQCSAPCAREGDREAYAVATQGARELFAGDAREVIEGVRARLSALALEGRYEDAQVWRDRLEALLRGVERAHQRRLLQSAEEIVAAQNIEGAWHIHVIRHGRLAAAGVAPRGQDPRPLVDALLAVAEIPHGEDVLVEEVEMVWRWLTADATRLVRASEPLALPVHLGAGTLESLRAAREASSLLHYSADRRALRPTA